MKIRLGKLRQLVKEVAVSPSVFKNNQPIAGPLENVNVSRTVAALEQPFKRALETNMVLGAEGSYDEETRELDDGVYSRIKATSDKATTRLMARVRRAVQVSWDEAMTGKEPAAQQKKVAA